MLNKRLINSNNAASGGACASDALQVLGDTSCIALYPLNYDGSDVSGNYDGTTTDVSFSNGKIDEAANFNGSSSKITISSLSTFLASSNFCLFIAKASSPRIKNSPIKIKKIVIMIARPKPSGRKDLKRMRAPKKTIAHDAPSKKLRILSNLSFCIESF
jgi:hypothetical protein